MYKLIGVWFVCLLLLPFSMLPLGVYAQTENNFFVDNFEGYQVGSFPSAGGWEIVWDGMGQSHQVISTSYSYSPTRSFQIWGTTGWSAVVQRRFSTNSPVIGYEFSILIDERGSGYTDHLAFFCRDCETWGAYYGTVVFDHSDGRIKAENGAVLGTWSPRTWYRVKVILDRQSNRYSVWINGELRGQNIPTSRSDTNRINAIALGSGWAGKKTYYDDVRVFTVVQQQVPNPSISPDRGEVSVNHGETFTVTFRARNSGGTPNDRGWSHVTISVSGGLEIVSWTRWSDRDKKFNIGDPIWNRDGRQIPAQHEMIETYAYFPSGSTRDLTVTFRAKSPGNQWINFRFTLVDFTQDEDWTTARYYRDPPSSNITDQQGWPVKRINVLAQTPLPDLTVTSVSFSPSVVSVGEGVTVSWVEKNQGSGNAGLYRVGIYFGRTEYGRDFKLGEDNSTGLSAGASRSRSLRFTVPNTVPAGTYYVTVFIDETDFVRESNENNNIGSTTPTRITVQQPTFRVEILSFDPPSSASPGQTVSVPLTVRYEFSNLSYVGVAISRRLADGSYERVWNNPDYETPRSGQGTLSYTASFQVPSQPGTHSYIIRASYWDRQQWIKTDEKYFSIVVQQPTQLAVDVWTNKGGQGRGNTNGGQYNIGESITLYCSVNINVDSLRIKVIRPDGVEVIALERGSSSAGTYTASGQVGEPAGERRVICDARSGGQSSSDEVRFNVVRPSDTTPPTVRVIAPNGGETLFPDDVFRIRWEASDNVGVERVHIWLFQGNTQVMVIASNLPNTGYYDWTVPNRTGGNYRIRIAAVDAAGNTAHDDSDGTFEIGAIITVTAQIVSLTTDKSQYSVGETVRVLYTIRNTGDIGLDLRMVVEIVNPSGQPVYDSHRTDQDKRHTLDPGQSASGEFTWRIPADAAPGTYEVRASLRDWNIWDKIFDHRWGDRPGPRFTVVQQPPVEIRALDVRLSVGEDGSSRLILNKAPAGLAGYELIVRLVPQAGVQRDIVDVVDIRFPEWAGLTDKSINDDQARFSAVDIQDMVRAGGEEIVLAEVVLRGKAEGTVRIELIVIRMDDDLGGSIPVIIRHGTLEVVRVGPPPVEENLSPPRDLDGDGLYEDVNGNGRLDYDDVVKFFRHFNDPVITQYHKYYDFNRNGRLDYDDIVELFKMI